MLEGFLPRGMSPKYAPFSFHILKCDIYRKLQEIYASEVTTWKNILNIRERFSILSFFPNVQLEVVEYLKPSPEMFENLCKLRIR